MWSFFHGKTEGMKGHSEVSAAWARVNGRVQVVVERGAAEALWLSGAGRPGEPPSDCCQLGARRGPSLTQQSCARVTSPAGGALASCLVSCYASPSDKIIFLNKHSAPRYQDNNQAKSPRNETWPAGLSGPRKIRWDKRARDSMSRGITWCVFWSVPREEDAKLRFILRNNALFYMTAVCMAEREPGALCK